ncbi:transposase, Mutator family protein [Streptococcus pyogenes]|nr:transposase, Mutator family protein [Streptococcus pyogenes]
MTQFTTELLNFLAQKQDIDEFFRSSLEIAMNDLLQVELSAFLGYESYEKEGYNTGIAVMGLILVSLKQSMA